MRIYTSTDGGSYVNAISSSHGTNVDGHLYQIVSGTKQQELFFQLGPVKEAGVNGCQNEQIIEVLLHRLSVLDQAFPCSENRLAIANLQSALGWLDARTRERQRRGVEGKNEP
jgi:hypothetical protein